jgi:hypothetical protein
MPSEVRVALPWAALLGSQPFDRAAEWEFLSICHSLPILAEVRASDGRKRIPLNLPALAMAVSVKPYETLTSELTGSAIHTHLPHCGRVAGWARGTDDVDQRAGFAGRLSSQSTPALYRAGPEQSS